MRQIAEKKIIKELNINGFKVIRTESIIPEVERNRLNSENVKKTIEVIKTILPKP